MHGTTTITLIHTLITPGTENGGTSLRLFAVLIDKKRFSGAAPWDGPVVSTNAYIISGDAS